MVFILMVFTVLLVVHIYSYYRCLNMCFIPLCLLVFTLVVFTVIVFIVVGGVYVNVAYCIRCCSHL